MEIIQCKNKEEASNKAAEALSLYFQDNIDKEVLFLSCGGSGIKMLNNVKSESLAKNLTVIMLDSRLQVEAKDENYYQLTQTDFYARALKRVVNFLDIAPLRTVTLKEAGERFEALIKNLVASRPEVKIIASMGMGPDGHIAGIIPFPEDKKTFDGFFKDENRLALAYEVPTEN